MITRQITRILLLTAAVGAAGCSSSSTRFGDFYASAAPQGAVVDNTATGSIAPANSFQNAPPMSGAPAQAAYNAPATTSPKVTRGQLPAASGSTNVVSRMANGVRNMLPRSEPKAHDLPRVTAEPVRTTSTIAPHARKMRVTVKEGQTLSSLSRRYGVSVGELMKQNGIAPGDTLRTGQRLVVPAYAASGDPMPVQATAANPANLAAAAPKPTSKAVASAPKLDTTTTGSIKVVEGDTLFGISRKTGVSVAKLRELNGLSSDGVRIGQTLKLPSGTTTPQVAAPVQTASLQTKSKPLAAPASPVKAEPTVVAAAPQAAAPQAATKAPRVVPVTTAANPVVEAAKPVAEKVETVVASAEPVAPPKASTASALRWPVKGRVIRGFGGGSSGLDISAPSGSQIRAAENGTVIYAGSGLKQYGKTVLIQHENGLVTVYGHADTLGVAKGQKVNRGDVIASSGMTGQAETPRVHFQVRKGQTPVDPNTYLR